MGVHVEGSWNLEQERFGQGLCLLYGMDSKIQATWHEITKSLIEVCS